VFDKSLDHFRERVKSLEARLASVKGSSELAPLKGEIGVLYLAIEHDIVELTALRDGVKNLIENWKNLKSGKPMTAAPASPAPAAEAPQFSPEKPVIHADHLGASTFIEKGWSKISLADYDGAEQALRKALDLAPNDVQAEALLGWALMLQEKHDEALMTFQKVLVREPHNALARVNVGYICLKKQIFGEAIEHLARAIKLDNDKKATLYAHFYLGLVYLEREMFEDAATFFEKALALGPGLIEAYHELGRACWRSGKRDKAIHTWTTGRDANAFNPWSKRCGEMIERAQAGGKI
jgi:tetratricopeptide (TPR) repeat protein